MPLDVVAAQVISNAESDTDKRPSAQVATTAAAADVVAEAEKDEAKARPIVNQAEANAETNPQTKLKLKKPMKHRVKVSLMKLTPKLPIFH